MCIRTDRASCKMIWPSTIPKPQLDDILDVPVEDDLAEQQLIEDLSERARNNLEHHLARYNKQGVNTDEQAYIIDIDPGPLYGKAL